MDSPSRQVNVLGAVGRTTQAHVDTLCPRSDVGVSGLVGSREELTHTNYKCSSFGCNSTKHTTSDLCVMHMCVVCPTEPPKTSLVPGQQPNWDACFKPRIGYDVWGRFNQRNNSPF
jgi:hypothetical protein